MNQSKTRIPAPIYAAAGAGELAYQQLRKLPMVMTGLSGKAVPSRAELREKAATTTAQLREKAATTTAELREKALTTAAELRNRANGGVPELDVDRLRTLALRNAALVMTGAQAAQERAVTAYNALVVRGERVVGTGVVQAADTVNADMTVTEEQVAEEPVTATEQPATPATVAEQPKAEQVEAPLSTRAKRVTKRTTSTGTGAAEAGTPARTTRATKTTKAVKRTRPAADAE